MSVLVLDRSKKVEQKLYPLFGVKDSDLNKPWYVWRGSKEGQGLVGNIDQDVRTLWLHESIDLSSVKFTDCSELLTQLRTTDDGEQNESLIEIRGEERRQYLFGLRNRILLDPGIGIDLWLEKGHCGLEFIRQSHGVTHLEFYGTILRRKEDAGPVRFVFVLYYYSNTDGWKWYYRRLNDFCGLGNMVPYVELRV